MEAKAGELLAVFKNPNVSIDSRVAHLTAIKSDIKQKNVPEEAILTIFDTLRLAINSQHYSVASAGFSTLGHFLKRLSIQNQQQWILSQARNLYPVLLERLGDHKERVRAQSASIFTELWSHASNDAEYYVLECALVGKNPRAKETSMLWLSSMTRNHGLLFRQYVPSLVACLEDADSAVRDTARSVVVELFKNGSARAKSDLQKQLVARGVRKSIANAILSNIGLGAEPEGSARPISRAERPVSVMSTRSHAVDMHDDDQGAIKIAPPLPPQEAPSRPKTPAEAPSVQKPLTEEDGLEPFLVSSSRDIEDTVRDMAYWFEGKESEDNWMKREKSAILLRRMTRGNAPHDFSQTFVHAIKSLLDGIFKVVHSLRTTLCTAGCLLIQDVAQTCGPKIDGMVEIMMQNLIKLCGSLKKIAAQNGHATVDAVIGNVTFNIRILQHVHFASQDKNVQLRHYAAGWLRTLISRQSHHKSTVEHGGGLDLIEKSLRKGLGDANPGVREAVRSTFWVFYSVWPERANVILSDLDSKSRNLLEKDPSNPNAGQRAPASGKTANGPGAGRSALKEAIAAKRKANMPSRPESAQPAFAESRAPESSKSTARTPPMRPAMKPRRAEISRPATADPYASRPNSRAAQSSSSKTPVGSPRSVKSKGLTPSSKPISAPRLRPHETSQTGTTRGKPKKLDLSKSKSHGDLAAASHTRSNSEDSAIHQNQLNSSHADYLAAYEERDEHTPVLLESPPLSASQPPVHIHQPLEASQEAAPEPVEPMEEPQSLTLNEPDASHSPSTPRMEPVVPHDSDAATEPEPLSKSQPDEMVIYEDPDTPVAVEVEPAEIAPVEQFTPQKSPAKSPARSPARSPRHTGDEQSLAEEAVAQTPAGLESSTKHSPIELTPQQSPAKDTVVNEPHFQSPVRRTPLRGSPSPSRNRLHITPSDQAISMGSIIPQEPPREVMSEQTSTKENANVQNKLPEYTAAPRSAAKSGALEEVSLNESTARSAETRQRSLGSSTQSTGEETLRRSRKWAERHRSPSPRSKDPANAREMLPKAMSRITSKSMDISGYRKLQGLFQYHGEELISDEQDYYAVLGALLNELESTPMNRKDHDVKTQILATIRSMLIRTSEMFHQYDISAMASLIRARQHYESNSHFVTCLEEVAEQLVALIPTPTSIAGVLQGLDLGEDANSEGAYRSVILGLSIMQQALAQASTDISDDVLASVGGVVSQQLNHSRPGVRKQATELCTLLNLKFGLDRVQKLTQPAGEGSLNLLTYFMARRSQ
ncbi:Protein stu1 [Penicillium citrinum]|uniref:Protein stu1 n=2 Tax=Penicillium TaxID=5073 RepID=A0A9W9TKQ1_PENCI|nr:Protein stu1 [Penicillium citrinum]KAJ5224765.1 Protein stu1 [Penicillium citrinum]KAJ5575020.1 Protein stu1 [Penicillium hetheringtonii]